MRSISDALTVRWKDKYKQKLYWFYFKELTLSKAINLKSVAMLFEEHPSPIVAAMISEGGGWKKVDRR